MFFFGYRDPRLKPSELERSFFDFVDRNGLLAPGDRGIAAVSGGVDSMVMLNLLDRLRAEINFDLSVAHVNHGLRGPESDGDEQLVRTRSLELGVEFHLHRSPSPIQPGGGRSGIQEWAREERYRFFESLRSNAGRTRIATAHHRDDNAETVLFNFLRGSGIHGLTGIPVAHADGFVIRPLLFATREQILGYSRERAVPFREDSSNAGMGYTRNVLRHSVIPSIESAVNPGLRETLVRTTRLFTDLESFVAGEVDRALPAVSVPSVGTDVRLSVEAMAGLPLFLQESILHRCSRQFHPSGIGQAHVRALIDLLGAQAGSACLVSKHLHAAREAGLLVMRRSAPAGEPFDFPVRAGEAYAFAAFSFSSGFVSGADYRATALEEFVDAELLGGDLRLRSWSDGDWFVPLGMADRKKLSDYFVDRKIPVSEKNRVPILTSGEAIVWVCGERLDERFKITPRTERILRLTYEPGLRWAGP